LIFRGDCLEVMATLPSETIDLTVTSPPYDNLRTYNGTLSDWTEDKWKAIIAELYRLTKQGGVVVWVVADATIDGSETGTSFRQALYATQCGFNLHDTMIWNKLGTNFPDKNRYYQCFEYMFVWAKGKPKTINLLTKENRSFGRIRVGPDRNPDGSTRPSRTKPIKQFGVRFNVWDQHSEKGSIRSLHPATFPETLASDHILSWSNEGDAVFDPFLGSGTTGKMAIQNGREFIGIERDPAYFEIARSRIEAATPELFRETA
jgi:DNA modification methylase